MAALAVHRVVIGLGADGQVSRQWVPCRPPGPCAEILARRLHVGSRTFSNAPQSRSTRPCSPISTSSAAGSRRSHSRSFQFRPSSRPPVGIGPRGPRWCGVGGWLVCCRPPFVRLGGRSPGVPCWGPCWPCCCWEPRWPLVRRSRHRDRRSPNVPSHRPPGGRRPRTRTGAGAGASQQRVALQRGVQLIYRVLLKRWAPHQPQLRAERRGALHSPVAPLSPHPLSSRRPSWSSTSSAR